MKLVKVDTKDNYADLMTKILEPETFANLRDGMMVNVAIPESVVERSSTSISSEVPDEQAAGAEVPGTTSAPEAADDAECGTGCDSEEAKRNRGLAGRRPRKGQ